MSDVGAPRGLTRWRARPAVSRALRLVVLLVPVLCAAVVNILLSHLLPLPSGAIAAAGWWVLVVTVSSITMLATFSGTRRLLPLAVLLDMSLVFPESAPSRWAMARRQPNVKTLNQQLAAARERGQGGAELDRSAAIVNLAVALSAHDSRTRGHSERVRLFTEMLAAELRLSADERDRLRWASLLHDIGKLTVPREILNKPGKPDDREWAILREHPREGARIVAQLMPWLGTDLGGAVEHHHEKYDGSGYPGGLAAEAISLGGRIVAVADSFEVMTAARPYKRPLPPQAARRELVANAGTQFDPAIVRAFLGISLGRLWTAIGPSALLAQVPALAQLPARLGNAFAPATAATVSVVASVAVGASLASTGVLVTANSGPWVAYVVNDLSTSDSVSAITTATNRVISTVPAGSLPLGIAIAPDGRTAYVVDDGLTGGFNTITPIDLSGPKPRPLPPVSTGVNNGSNWIAITPDGRRALVTDPGAGAVTPFDLTTSPPTRGALLAVGGHPEGIAIAPDGQTAYVTDMESNSLIPIDLRGPRPVAELPIMSPRFNAPFGIAITPDGRRAYVANLNGDTVLPIDLTTAPARVGPAIRVGLGPVWIAITPNGNTVLVTDGRSGAVTPIAVDGNVARSAIRVGGAPYAVAITPDGTTAYVTDGNGSSVTPIDLTGSATLVRAPIQVGSYPRGIIVAGGP